jgi:hypothetical protein
MDNQFKKWINLFETTLLEAMNPDMVKEKLSNKLLAVMKNDTLLKDKENVDALIQEFVKADPTLKKGYIEWIARRYIDGNFLSEDLERVKITLENFEKYKRQLEKKDINQYKTLADLDAVLDPLIQTGTSTKSGKETKREIKKAGIDTVFSTSAVKIIRLKTKEAAIFYGANTKWCTAATESTNYFNHYNNQGPIYIIFLDNGRKYQLHCESQQFKDEKDIDVPKDQLFKITQKYPDLIVWLKEINQTGSQKDKSYISSLIFIPENYDIYDKMPSGPMLLATMAELYNKRLLEVEPIIAKNAAASYLYAKNIIKGKFKLGEKIITDHDIKIDDVRYAYEYARDIIKGVWPEGEFNIARRAETAFLYAKNILKDKFPAGEKAISNNSNIALKYALIISNSRNPAFEKKLLKSSDYMDINDYIINIIKGRWPEFEKIILNKNIPECIWYAQNVIKGRWPELEDSLLAKNTEFMFSIKYALEIIKGPWPAFEKKIINVLTSLVESDTSSTLIPTLKRLVPKYIADVRNGNWPEAQALLNKL